MGRSKTPAKAAEFPWSSTARLMASLALLWHLAATLIGPLSLPPTILSDYLLPLFGPYHKAIFGGHAYKFFAPDPGPSHLIEFDVERADGSHVTGTFPDRSVNFPRLLYHRHFMLTESVGHEIPDPNSQARSWQESVPSPMQRQFAESYADHLLAVHQGTRVTLTLVRHEIATPTQIAREHVKLTDPRSYQRAPLIVRRASEGTQP